MHALLIVNDAAGSLNGEKAKVSVDDVIAAFAEEGHRLEPRLTSCAELCATLTAAVQARPEAIFVGGGDGSISAAAGCMAGTPVPLGVIPLGTLNHFARDLGLPVAWREAVKALAHGNLRSVDVGEVNGRVFINNCSIGSYPEAVRQRDALRAARGLGKWWAMAMASWRVFRRLRRMRLRINVGDTTSTLRTPFVFVGNNAYSGHVFDHSLRPRLDGGQLSIYTTRAHRRLTLVRLAWQSIIRKIDAADALETQLATAAVISSERDQPLPVAADGELLPPARTLRFRIRPGALKVIAPTPAAAAS